MGHMEKLWDRAVAKESYSANGDLDYDFDDFGEKNDYDAYAAAAEGSCWCGNDSCEHIQSNPQHQCCICTDAGDTESMCEECQSLVSSYSAASAVAPYSPLRPRTVATHRGIDIVKVGGRYRVFWPGAGRYSLSSVSFPSIAAATKWLDDDGDYDEEYAADGLLKGNIKIGDAMIYTGLGAIIGALALQLYYTIKGGK